MHLKTICVFVQMVHVLPAAKICSSQ
jgi:hypothetical protein